MRNPHKAIEAIELLVGSDFGLDMEWVSCPDLEKNPKRAVSRLRKAGEMITLIYQIVHSENNRGCRHTDWEDIKYDIIEKNQSI